MSWILKLAFHKSTNNLKCGEAEIIKFNRVNSSALNKEDVKVTKNNSGKQSGGAFLGVLKLLEDRFKTKGRIDARHYGHMWLMCASAVGMPVAHGAESPPLPCDLTGDDGTSLCVAAHRVTRVLRSNYGGPLFQLQRESDGKTMDIMASMGVVDVEAVTKFCASEKCGFSIIYDQMATQTPGDSFNKKGNYLSQDASYKQPLLSWAASNNIHGGYPMVSTTGGRFLRNRMNTSGIPTGGNQSTSEYMVIDTLNNSVCCGTYGNMESPPHDDGKGTMFALAYSVGAEGNYEGSNGPWPGVDWENGVYLYPPTKQSRLLTLLASYDPQGPHPQGPQWSLLSGDATISNLNTLYSGSLPSGYTADFKGGLSLGEGGDGSWAPVNFFEGAIYKVATTEGQNQAIQKSISEFYSSSIKELCPTENLLQSPLNLTNSRYERPWVNTSSFVVPARDPLGGYTAGEITNTSGSPYSNISQTVNLIPGGRYVFTDYVFVDSTSSLHPGGSIQIDDAEGAQFAWVLDAEQGKLVQGTWGTREPDLLSAKPLSTHPGWWKIIMQITVPHDLVSSSSAAAPSTVFLDPPIAGSHGSRYPDSPQGQNPPGMSAIHYCPNLQRLGTQ